MKANKLAVITALILDQVSRELFKNSKEVTITKGYFEETVSKTVAKESSKVIIKALQLMKSGVPGFIAAILARTEVDLAGITSVHVMDASEHTDCSTCDKAEGCDIKDVMTKLNTLKADDKMSPEEKKQKIGQLLKEPFKHTGNPSKN